MAFPEYREGPLRDAGAVVTALRELVLHLNRFIREFNDSLTASVVWTRITGRPTTLAGYGITDAAAASHRHDASEIDNLPAVGGSSGAATPIRYADLLEKPTTVAGFGISDASRIGHTHPFSEINSRPNTLAGYGITDASPLGHDHDSRYDGRYAPAVHHHDDRYYTEAESDAFIGRHRAVITADAVLETGFNYLLLGPVSYAGTLEIPSGATLVTL